ncbi:MAG: LEA type 2 family protein [Bacteroidota bacterium]|nr:LEA type 2 family protein [Bacteroidota bacterium]
MKILSVLMLFIVGLSSCGKMEEPQFKRLENFNLKSVGLKETVVGFDATLHNPNSFGVTIKESAVDVYLDSVFAGNFKQTEQISVKSEADFSIPLEGKIPISRALNMNLPGLIGKEVLVRADGSVKVGKGGVYVTKEFTFEGLQRLTPDLLKNPADTGSND